MTVYDQIAKNKRRTVMLMAVFFAFIFAIGFFLGEYYGVGGYGGLFYAGIFSIAMGLASYYGGARVALVSSGAKEITKEQSPYVYNMVENLCITAGIPVPKVHIIEDQAMNAFATGRNPENASIAVTTGIIDGLERLELEAVIAHELSHVKNYDIRVMTIVIVLVGMISIIGDFFLRAQLFGGGRRSSNRNNGQAGLILMIVGIVFILVSPIIAELIKLAISRKREYLADASAVLLTRYADGLADALQKIANQDMQMKRASTATAHLFFSSPFSSKKMFSRLFSTHPPLEDRIAALRKMGGTPQ